MRAILTFAFACSLGLVAPALAQTKMTVVTFAGATNIAVWIASDKGYFKREGLDVTHEITRGSTAVIEGLMNGTYQIASTAFDNHVANTEGVGDINIPNYDLIGIAGVHSGMNKIVTRPEIKNFADLKGKVVASDALTSGYGLVLVRSLEMNGLKRDRELTRETDVGGTARVLEGVAAAGVPLVVHASSVAAYGPRRGGPDERVDESWPTTGIPTSFYSREKVAAEGLLNDFEASHPEVRVVRMRPFLVFQRSAAEEIRRYFLGPFWPSPLVRPGRVPVVPLPPSLRFQAVHSDDVAEAFRLVLHAPDARGAYNVASDPAITPRRFAKILGGSLGGVPIPVPARALRLAAKATWLARVQPTPPGWVDLGMQSPLLSTDRIRALGWVPRHDGPAVLRELLEGLHDRAGGDTPPLHPRAGGRFRMDELRTGVGGGS